MTKYAVRFGDKYIIANMVPPGSTDGLGEIWDSIDIIPAATVWADWYEIPHAEAKETLMALPDLGNDVAAWDEMAGWRDGWMTAKASEVGDTHPYPGDEPTSATYRDAFKRGGDARSAYAYRQSS